MGTVSDSIKERLRAEIAAAGSSLVGTCVPSERALQHKYQVSRPTISRALGELAAEGLIVRPEGRRRYMISRGAPASRLAVSDSRRIGFVGGDFASVSFGAELGHRVFRGIHETASRRGIRVLMGIATENLESERMAARDLIASGAAGLVIWPFPRQGADIERDYLVREDLGVPVVLLDNCTAAQGGTQVVFDNRRAGYDITSWLV